MDPRRWPLLAQLAAYDASDEQESELVARLARFVEQEQNPFDRSTPHGHLTGSAWIVDVEFERVLLVHHGKLERWLQPGGHLEPGDANALAGAQREAREETGLQTVALQVGALFDVDIHPIPARVGQPEHLHYDLRFLLKVDPDEAVERAVDAHELRWIELDDVKNWNCEQSLTRMVAKTHNYRASRRGAVAA